MRGSRVDFTRWLTPVRADHDAAAARSRALELLGQTVGTGLAE